MLLKLKLIWKVDKFFIFETLSLKRCYFCNKFMRVCLYARTRKYRKLRVNRSIFNSFNEQHILLQRQYCILERVLGEKIDSWNWGGTKYGIESATWDGISKLLRSPGIDSTRFLAPIDCSKIPALRSSLPPPPKKNSKGEKILTRNRFCGFDAWVP